MCVINSALRNLYSQRFHHRAVILNNDVKSTIFSRRPSDVTTYTSYIFLKVRKSSDYRHRSFYLIRTVHEVFEDIFRYLLERINYYSILSVFKFWRRCISFLLAATLNRAFHVAGTTLRYSRASWRRFIWSEQFIRASRTDLSICMFTSRKCR